MRLECACRKWHHDPGCTRPGHSVLEQVKVSRGWWHRLLIRLGGKR